MPVTHETWLKTDLKRPITVQPLRGLLFSADNQGDKVGFEVYDNGNPVALSGVITGYIIKNNGETVVVSGSFDGNKAWIVCPANAYDAIGPVYIAIKNRASTATTAQTTTLGMCTTYVERTATGEIVTPTYKIIDTATIVAMIDDAEAATAAANTAASAANTAANKLENMDAAASTLAPESAATANVSTVSGHYRINLGLPKGDTGDNAAITGVTTSYATNDSASTVPADSAFGPTPPTVPQGNYLWTKTTLTWNNGQTTILNLPSRQGRDGSGSVSSVNNVSPDNNGNVNLGEIVYKVNNVSPDSSGNVALPIDSAPTAGSSNPVSSGGTKTALDAKVNKSGDTMTGNLIIDSGRNYSGIIIKGADPSSMLRVLTTGGAFVFDQYANGSTGGDRYLLPNPEAREQDAWYGILTTKPGTGSLYYAAGETYTISVNMPISGHVTGEAKAIHLGLWLPKSLERISQISVTALQGAMRGANGYVNAWYPNTNILTQSGITVSAAQTSPNAIDLQINNSTAYTNVNTNTLVSFDGKITLSFS